MPFEDMVPGSTEGHGATLATWQRLAAMYNWWVNTPHDRLPQRRRSISVSDPVPFLAAITDVDTTSGKCSWKAILPPGVGGSGTWSLGSPSGDKTEDNYAIDDGGSTQIVIGDIVELWPVTPSGYYPFLYNPPMMQANTVQVIPSGGGGLASVNGNEITIFNMLAANSIPSSKVVYISFSRNPNPSFPSVGGTSYIAGKGNWIINIAPC